MRGRWDDQALVLRRQKTPDADLYAVLMSVKFHADFHGSDDKNRKLKPECRSWTKPVGQGDLIGDKLRNLV
jgi:hypothetical protein